MNDIEFDQPIPSPENPLKQKKEVLWQKMSDEFSQIADKLGQPIDAGIMDTVVGFNVLGITTRQSCEGHVDTGTGAPWVDVEAKGQRVKDLKQKADQAWEIADKAEKADADEKELNRVFKEAHQASHEARAEHLRIAQKVMTCIEEFYTDRQVSADRRLILTHSALRLESQGSAFQNILDPQLKQQKLSEYQEEMKTFTYFLKERFLSDETPIEPGEEILKDLETNRLQYTTSRLPLDTD